MARWFVGQQPADGGLGGDPAVTPQPLAEAPANPGDPGGDPATAQMATEPGVVAALVSVQIDRPAPRMPTARRAAAHRRPSRRPPDGEPWARPQNGRVAWPASPGQRPSSCAPCSESSEAA